MSQSADSPIRRRSVSGAMEISIQELVEESLRNGHGVDAFEMERSLSTVPDPPVVYEDPYLSVRDGLWFHAGINELVRTALYKMEKAFAYNSVFFLKAVLDLQLHYLALELPLPPSVKLEPCYAERIAEILALRLARREKDNSSPSRELQLRTLVAALSLLDQQQWKLENDAYAKLLDRISERDYENHTRYLGEGLFSVLGSGDCEFLVRYACDLVRSMPNDYQLRKIETFGSQAVHFMIAEGLVDQSGGEPTLEYMNEIYTRLAATPSDWHEDAHLLSETVSHAMNLEYQSKSTRNDMLPVVRPRPLPGNIPRIIIERIQKELNTGNLVSADGVAFAPRETQLFVITLLDLLVQLVTTFPACEEAIESSEQLALNIITTSNDRELRLKAFELIIASTTGCDEDEFFDAMRDLESYIVKVAGARQGTDIEELQYEKRAAMDRFDKKMILYRGAIESLHRRLQDRARGGRDPTGRSLTVSPSWELARERLTVSPAASGTIFCHSVSDSPVSQFTPPMRSDSFSRYNNVPSTSNPPVSHIGDQQQSIRHDMHRFVAENYDRSGTSLSDYPKKDDIDPSNCRPLSFQRDAVEILQVPSHRRKKIQQQLPTLPTAEEEIATHDYVGTHTTRYMLTSDINTKGASVMEYSESLTVDLEEFRPRRNKPSGNNTVGVWQQSSHIDEHHGKDEDWVVVEGLQKIKEPKEVLVKENEIAAASPAGVVPCSDAELAIVQRDKDSKICAREETPGTVNERAALSSAEPQPAKPTLCQKLPPQPYEDKIPVDSLSYNNETLGQVETEKTSFTTGMIDNLLIPGDRDTKCSFDLPIQGVNDENYCLTKEDSGGRERRRSAMSPIPLASELPDTPRFGTEIEYLYQGDGSDAPEVVEFITEGYSNVPTKDDVNIVPKKKPSRASRLFSSLPGSSVKGSRLSRLGSLRFTTSQPSRTPTPVNFASISDEGLEVVPQCHPLVLRKSQTGPAVRNEKMEILRRANIVYRSAPESSDSSPNLSSEPLVSPSAIQGIPGFNVLDYDAIAAEHVYKLAPKENFLSFLTLDCRHAVYMSNDSFQVFAVPTPHDPVPLKARYTYRLGESEGLKKGKVPWEYKSGAASRRYIATITKERIQIHDLQQACAAIYTKKTQDHEYHSVAIAADKMAVGMTPINGGSGKGVITIFKMRSTATKSGQKWEEWRLIRLTVPLTGISTDEGTPYFLSLTRDGKGLTTCTKSGHFFAWDITGRQPVLISSGRVITQEGVGSEVLTASFLFPDMKHILCSTMSMNDSDPGWVGCFTEPTSSDAPKTPHHPIRQVGLKIHHSAISPNGNATAFLSRTGRIYVVPILHVEGDPNVTSTAATSAEQRLLASAAPEAAGRIMFTPEGDKLIGVDKKGRVIVLDFTKL